MTPCSPLSCTRHFGGTYRLRLQGRRNKFSKNPASKQVARCNPLSFNRRFGGTYRLHLQGRRNKFSKKPASKQVASTLPCVPPKRRLKLNGLQGITSQKMILFITTTVKTSNPTYHNISLLNIFLTVSMRYRTSEYGKMVMNGEWIRIWKKVVMACLNGTKYEYIRRD
jgi:hypothetical protein